MAFFLRWNQLSGPSEGWNDWTYKSQQLEKQELQVIQSDHLIT